MDKMDYMDKQKLTIKEHIKIQNAIIKMNEALKNKKDKCLMITLGKKYRLDLQFEYTPESNDKIVLIGFDDKKNNEFFCIDSVEIHNSFTEFMDRIVEIENDHVLLYQDM